MAETGDNMNDFDVINWCRDMLLQNVNADAEVVYKACRLAEEDRGMYDLLTEYAYHEGSVGRQDSVYGDMVDYMEARGLC